MHEIKFSEHHEAPPGTLVDSPNLGYIKAESTSGNSVILPCSLPMIEDRAAIAHYKTRLAYWLGLEDGRNEE